jgi:NAD(P)-dependent dehydrogenase (short-subunit alcohol dehydrogenase family)
LTSPSGIEGSVNLPVYSPVKGAQRALAKSLAREWGGFGITVNCIAPVAETPALTAAFAQDPVLKERLTARTPLGRVGRATEDIGAVAVFLASEDAGYVTGQTIVCDGGSFMGL